MTVEYIGPIDNSYPYIITIDGVIVPHITGAKLSDGRWSLKIKSHAIDTNEEEIQKWIPFLSDAMAYCAGYTFGDNSHPINIFSRRAYGINVEEVMQSTNDEDNKALPGLVP